MATQDIYNNRRVRIGRVITGSDGSADIYDIKGVRLGKFSPRQNRTLDRTGKSFGFGYQLLGLLDCDPTKR